MELVLDGREKFLSDLGTRVVVHRRPENVGDLPVEPLLRGADVPDALEQLIEVVRAQAAAFLEPLVVHDESLDQVLPQPLGGPAPELRPPVGPHPIADRQDRF